MIHLKKWIKKQTQIGKYSSMENVYTDMAVELGIGVNSIKQWVAGQRRVGAHHVLNIEKLTNGEVTRHQLRNDLYPD